jgi:hypothetical protein
MIEAELALITVVDDPLQVRAGQPLRVAVDLVPVQRGEQTLEGRAEGQAAPTAIADVGDAPQLAVELVPVPELRRPDVKDRHHDLSWSAEAARRTGDHP